jgi:predicted nucleic acid-binding protein
MPSLMSSAPFTDFPPTLVPAWTTICGKLDMGAIALADTSFVVALLNSEDSQHEWAVGQAAKYVTPWQTCESVLSEADHILGSRGWPALAVLLSRSAIIVTFHWEDERVRVLALMHKYADLPMALADACLVRMTELMSSSVVLTVDSHFRLYRRHGRQVVPCVIPD